MELIQSSYKIVRDYEWLYDVRLLRQEIVKRFVSLNRLSEAFVLQSAQVDRIDQFGARLDLEDRSSVHHIGRHHWRIIAECALSGGFQEVQLGWTGCCNPLPIRTSLLMRDPFMTSSILAPELPAIQIAATRLSLPILQVLVGFAENPDRRSGLVRVGDQRQIAMTESSRVMLGAGATTAQAVQRKRSDYWHPEDLERFEREWRSVLEPNNPESVIEFSFRGVDATGRNWRRFINTYGLVQDPFGDLYHVSSNVGFEEVQVPIGAR